MSLHLSNRMTDKQRAILVKLEYVGKWDLTVDEAAQIINELFEEERLQETGDQSYADWYNSKD
jgi:hypothetical protein